MSESLSILKEQAQRRGYREVLRTVAQDVGEGRSLSSALAKFPRVFGELAVSLIKVGEESGTLSDSLRYLADELKKKHVLRGKILGACIYPAIIIVATFCIAIFLVLYLFPKLIPVFSSLNAQLPLSTRTVMSVSVFLQQWGLWCFAAALCAALCVTVLVKSSRAVRLVWDRAILKFPVIGATLASYNLAASTRTVGLLLRSGVGLSQSLLLAAHTTRSAVYRRELEACARATEHGRKMSSYAASRPAYFPHIVGHMLAVGERSGSLPEVFGYLSELYEHEVDERAKNLSTMLEPALMLTMGLVVGFIAMSIITPIYGITQNLHS